MVEWFAEWAGCFLLGTIVVASFVLGAVDNRRQCEFRRQVAKRIRDRGPIR